MRKILVAAAAGALLAGAAVPALAQQSSTDSGTGFRMPYQQGFWGYIGGSVGGSEFGSCGNGNLLFSCDKRDTAWKVYGGGNFNQYFGGEIGFLDLGRANFSGGSAEARGIDFTLTGGVPVGSTARVFAKVGTVYGETDVHGSPAGLGNGRDWDWNWRYGLGATVGFAPNWQARLDLDRYRFQFPGRHDNVDTATIGVQYSFH